VGEPHYYLVGKAASNTSFTGFESATDREQKRQDDAGSGLEAFPSENAKTGNVIEQANWP
jgi:hypothetical protein